MAWVDPNGVPSWLVEKHPNAYNWRPDGDRRWRAKAGDLQGNDLLVVIDSDGRRAAYLSLNLAEYGSPDDVAEGTYRGLQAKMDMTAESAAVPVPVLLAAVDNALRNGSYMTGANLAFEMLCDRLGVDRDRLPEFDPRWSVDR